MLIRCTEVDRPRSVVGAVALASVVFAVAATPATAMPTWLPTTSPSTPAQAAVDGVAPAVAADGDLALLYTRGVATTQAASDAKLAELLVRPLSGTWSVALSGPATGSAAATTLGAADDGRAVGLWSGGSGNSGIFGTTRAAGGASAGAATKLSSGTIGTSPAPVVASNRAGVQAAAWVEGTSFTDSAQLVVRVRGAGDADFGAEERLTRPSDGYDPTTESAEPGARLDNGPRIAVASDGTVVVAWSQTDAKTHSGTRAYVASRAAGQAAFGAPQLVTDVATTTAASERLRALAIGADGTVAVGLTGTGGVMRVARRAPGATAFSAPVQVNGELAAGFGSQSTGATIAVDGAGRITAAYDSGGTSAAGRVWVTRQATAGGAFSEPVAVEAPADTYPRGVALAVSPAGDATLAWAEATVGSAAQRHARVVAVTRRGATGALSTPTVLDERDYTGDVPVTSPRIAVGPAGDALVAWGWNAGTAAAPEWVAGTAALDVEGPSVAIADVAPVVGKAVELRATATDRLSDVDEVRWEFGDGTTATGTDPEHTYRQAGDFRVAVTATDVHGNARTTTRTVTVAAPADTGLGTWLERQTLSTPAPSEIVVSPALSAGGDVAALYTRGTPDAGSDNASAQAEATVRPLGGDWSAPQTFGPTSGAAASATLSIGDDGRAFGLWNCGSSNSGMFGVGRDAGAARFGAEERVSVSAVSHLSSPSSASNRAGVTAVAYVTGAINNPRGLAVRVRAAGAAEFGPEQTLEAPAADWASGSEIDRNPKVVVAPDGTVTVAWSAQDSTSPGRTRAYTAVRRPGETAFAAPRLVTDVATTETTRENVRELAVGDDGTVAVGYLGTGGAMQVARRAPEATTFDAPVKVNGAHSGGFGSQSTGAALAVDGEGRITAVFDTGGVSTAGPVYVTQQATAGGAFSEPLGLQMPESTYARVPEVAVSPTGDAIVAWSDGRINSAPRHSRVVAVTRNGADGTWSAARVLDERDYEGTMLPPASQVRVAFAPDGDALVGWGMDTGTSGHAAWEARVAALDVAGPIVRDAAVDAVAGTAVTLRSGAADRFSAVDTVTWELGDGTTATGAEVSHAYADAGRYEARVTATDEHGHARTATQVVTVAAAASGADPTGPGDTSAGPEQPAPPADQGTIPFPGADQGTAPTASAVPRVSHVRLAGRKLTLKTTAAGRLRVDVERRVVRRVRKGGRTVTRVVYRRTQRLTVTAKKAGTVRLRVRKLAAGRYRVVVTPLGVRGATSTTKAVRVSR